MTLADVNITEIGPAGRPVTLDLDDACLRSMLIAAGVEAASGVMGAQLDVLLTRTGDTVLLRGSLRGEIWVVCSRCLGAARVELDEPALSLTFVPRQQAEETDTDEVELNAGDLSVFEYDGERIDLLALVRESVILSVPMAPLCSESCRGLEAGQTASAEAPGPAWKEVLRKLS